MSQKYQQIVVTREAPDPDEMGLVVRPIGGAAGSGDGAILDGVNSAIRGTVFDYANSNPQAVQLVDSNGDPLSGSAVSIADGADVAEGSRADTAWNGIAANATVISLLKSLTDPSNRLPIKADQGIGLTPPGPGTIPWIVTATDPTTKARQTVRSTTSVSGDVAAVVALTPDTPLPAGTNQIGFVKTDTAQPGAIASHQDILNLISQMQTLGNVVSVKDINTGSNWGIDAAASGRVRVFDGDGADLAISDGTLIDVAQRGWLELGSDVNGVSRFIKTDIDGVQLERLGSPTVTSGTIAAVGDKIPINTSNCAAVIIVCTGTTGSPTGQILFEATNNNGATWVNIYAKSLSGYFAVDDGTMINSIIPSGLLAGFSIFVVPCGGFHQIRLNAPTAFSGGTDTFALTGTPDNSFHDNGVKLLQGVNSVNTLFTTLARNGVVVGIKDPNTAPVAADPSLVVSISPNSSLPLLSLGSQVTVNADVTSATTTEDYIYNQTNQKLSQNKSGELRVAPNNDALIGAIEMLTAEVSDLRLVMQFAHGINLH